MAQFTKTWHDGHFMGWDDYGDDAPCTEASMPDDIGAWMIEADTAIFSELEPGQVKEVGSAGVYPVRYFRAY